MLHANESDRAALAVKCARLEQLLAEAVWRHGREVNAQGWVRRARELVPNLEAHFTPPCLGWFTVGASCDEAHAHGLECGSPSDVCERCGKTNAEHRAAWAALE